MEIIQLMQSIANNNVPHFNIWFGEEQKIIDLYLEKVISLGYKLVSSDSVSYVLDSIGRKSLDKSNKCYIINEDIDFTKAEDKWESVAKRFSSSNHIIICRYSKLDKKVKFYKNNVKFITEFVHLESNVLVNYINKELGEFDEKNAIKLVEICSNDYGRILLECNKIKCYANSHKISDMNVAFLKLLQDDAIYADIGDITFKLTDAVLSGMINSSLKYLQEANRKGEPAIMIASILYNGFRNQLAYKGLGSNKQEAGKRTGLSGWQIKQCIDQDKGYTLQEAERNMLFCQSVEAGIKTGKLDFDEVLDYLVIGCLK